MAIVWRHKRAQMWLHMVFALFNIDNIYVTMLYFVIAPGYHPLGVM